MRVLAKLDVFAEDDWLIDASAGKLSLETRLFDLPWLTASAVYWYMYLLSRP